ncbi:hypothetical protein Q8F55_005534 [Vanrija albida]|uniref:UBX domain-containing protein n=1 Tax=Vanrija albida TaxID=181172 RepID=A0ABR3Q2N6_9TREE
MAEEQSKAPVPDTPAAQAAQPDASAGPSTANTATDALSNVKVFAPPAETSGPQPVELDDAFFEHSISDVQALHASVTGQSSRLNNAPLLTNKHRDADRAAREQKKADKWPTATIRVKFSDGTQIQSTFPSTSPIQPVYDFIRLSLSPAALEKTFTLYQPPRTLYPEKPPPPDPKKAKPVNPLMKAHIVPPANYGHVRGGVVSGLQGGTGGKESLSDLGLVPQSVLLVHWDDAAMNASTFPAPLADHLKANVAPLPAPAVKAEAQKERKPLIGSGPDAKIPKWLQKGLLKKK